MLANVRGIDKPRVGLLNNGTESTKGDLFTRNYALLAEDDTLNFVGRRSVILSGVMIVASDGLHERCS